MKKKKDYTLEGYKKNYESTMNSKEKKIARKIEKRIYKKGEREIEINKSYESIYKKSDLAYYLSILFPFLYIVIDKRESSFVVYVSVKDDESEIKRQYESKLEILKKEVKRLEKENRKLGKLNKEINESELDEILDFYRGGMTIEKNSIRIVDNKGNEIKELVEYSGVFNKRYEMKAKEYLRLLEIERKIPNNILDNKEIKEEKED